ncbi:MAG: outer membrane protein assembly factor BamA [Candidatus Omnitrophota bacterium]
MKKKLFLFLTIIFGLFFVGLCMPASAQDQDSGQKRISDIRIKGNNSISTLTILNKLKLRAGDVFEESALNKELKRLYAMGYFADVFVETEDHEEGVVVTFAVVEKPIIDKIEFSGNSRIRSNRLAEKMAVKKGSLLDYHMLSQDVAELQKLYTDEGYSDVIIEHDVKIEPQTGKADVTIKVQEGYKFKIKSIEVEGNAYISDNEIKKYMETKTAWFFIRKGAFDEERVQSDLNRIKMVYRSKGFLDVDVTSEVAYSDDGDAVELTIIIDEGKEYRVGDIKIQGQLAFTEKDIKDRISIKTGESFDYQKIKEDMEKVRAFYYDKGYMDAKIDLQHKYNSTSDKMDLFYNIAANEEIYVGRIEVTGNTKTKDKIIRRELRVYPGEKYDGEKLKLSKERLYDMGFFEDVYFDTVSTSGKNVKDLHVTVKETKTGEFSFGGGYSSIDAFIGFVQIRQKNFDLLSFPSFTGSGQDLVVRAEVGSARTNYLLGWTDPWIFDYPLLLGFDLYRQEHERYGTSGYDYDEKRTGGNLKLGKELTEQISTGLVYNLEEVDISGIPEDTSQDMKDEKGSNWISRATLNLNYDTRDNRFSPTKGWISGFSVQNAGGVIGGDKDFVKIYAHTAFYYNIFGEVVLELTGRAGFVESYANTDKVPVYERYFAGGASTIRGYKQRGVGPRDSSDSNIVVGGESMVIGNAEITFPIFKKLVKGAVFYDAGTVKEKASDIFGFDDYKMGTGVGVRVKTPIGPVKLDYGYPISSNESDEREGQFYFSVSHGF